MFVVFLIAVGIMWYFGFAGPDPIFQDYSGESGSFLGRDLCTDYSSQNPYTKGTEAYSGFKWSYENPSLACIGSSAFRVGCEKQRELLDAYKQCARDSR